MHGKYNIKFGKCCVSAGEFGDKAKCTLRDLRFFTAVLLGIQVFWDVTLCCWVSSSCIEGSLWLRLQGSSLLLEGEGTTVLPNIWNHSCNTALHSRRLESFRNAPYYHVQGWVVTGKVISNPIAYLGGSKFQSLPRDCVLWQTVWFSSAPPGKFQDSTSIRPQLLPSRCFPVHYSTVIIPFSIT
jgi:hypothetical protein